MELIDLAQFPADDRAAVLDDEIARIQKGLNVEHGPLLRAALVSRGSEAAQKLLLVAHHLVIDGVSWRILIEDLESAYQQLARAGETPAFPLKSTSFKAWATRLNAYAGTALPARELPYWSALDTFGGALPANNAARQMVASERHVDIELDAATTRALLKDVPPVFQTQINDVLLTGLMGALYETWGLVALKIAGHRCAAAGREAAAARHAIARHQPRGAEISEPARWRTGAATAGRCALQLSGPARHGHRHRIRPDLPVVVRNGRTDDQSGGPPAAPARHRGVGGWRSAGALVALFLSVA